MALTISQIQEFVNALEYANIDETPKEIYSNLNKAFFALIESFFLSTPSTLVLSAATLRDEKTINALIDLSKAIKISKDTIESIALSLELYGNSEIKKIISDNYQISYPHFTNATDAVTEVIKLIKREPIGVGRKVYQTLRSHYLETGPLKKEPLKNPNIYEATLLIENQNSILTHEKLTIKQLQEVVKAIANPDYLNNNIYIYIKLEYLIASFFNPQSQHEILTSQELENHREELKNQNVNETAINNLIKSLQVSPNGAEIKEIISKRYKILLEQNTLIKVDDVILWLITEQPLTFRDQDTLKRLHEQYKEKQEKLQSTPKPDQAEESVPNENSNPPNIPAQSSTIDPITLQEPTIPENNNNNTETKPKEIQLTFEQIEEFFGILEPLRLRLDDNSCDEIYWNFSNLILSFFNQKRDTILTADELKNKKQFLEEHGISSETLDTLILSLEADPTGSEIKKLIFDKFKIAPDVKVNLENAKSLAVVILILLEEKYTKLAYPQELYNEIKKLTSPPEVTVVATGQVASEDNNPSNIPAQSSTLNSITLQGSTNSEKNNSEITPTFTAPSSAPQVLTTLSSINANPDNLNEGTKNGSEIPPINLRSDSVFIQTIAEPIVPTSIPQDLPPPPSKTISAELNKLQPAAQIIELKSKAERQKDFLVELKATVMQLDHWSKQARFSLFGKPPTHIGRLQNLVQPINLEECSAEGIEKLIIEAAKALISAKDYDSRFRKDTTRTTYSVLLSDGLKVLEKNENTFRNEHLATDANVVIAEARSLR